MAYELKQFTVESMAWTFGNFFPELADHFYDSGKGIWDTKFLTCMRALAIVADKECGDCFALKDFIEAVEAGGFNSYDGVGDFVDRNGNELGDVWHSDQIPAKAKFVMWYNK